MKIIKKIIFVIISIALTGFSSCENEDIKPETEYFFTFKNPTDSNIEEFKILVQFVRVYEINGNEESINTIYIGGVDLTYSKNDFNEEVLAFKADNDLSKAVAFDFGFDSSSLTVDGLEFGYNLLEVENSYRTEINGELSNENNSKLTFELDLENGLIKDENGDYKYLEKVNVKE